MAGQERSSRISRLYVDDLFQRQREHHLQADAEQRKLKNGVGIDLPVGIVLQRSTTLLPGSGPGTGEPPFQMVTPATNVAGHFAVLMHPLLTGLNGEFLFRGRIRAQVASALSAGTLLKVGVGTGQLVAATAGSKVVAQLEEDSAGGGALEWVFFDGLTGLGDQVLPVGASSSSVGVVARVFSLSLTPASKNAQTTTLESFACSGLLVGDQVLVNGPAPSNNVYMCAARVTGADSLGIVFVNPTGGALTPVAGTYTVYAFRA